MLEVIEKLDLGQWATFIIVLTVLWKTVFKSLVDSWFKNRLDLQKQQVGNALQIQKDLVLKQAEFEKVKLERVLPLLEEVNSAITEHNMIFNTYLNYVVNNIGSASSLDEKRLKTDERMIVAISSLSIYLPDEFRRVTQKLRLVISCYIRDPQVTSQTLKSFGANRTIPPLAGELYTDIIHCFHAMCAKYLGISEGELSYSDILFQHHLDEKVKTTRKTPEYDLAYKFILLHEYFGSNEQLEAQTLVEDFYK